MRPGDLFLDRPTDIAALSCIHPAKEGNTLACDVHLCLIDPRKNTEPTDELLPQLVSLPQVVYSEDEGVDDAEHSGHVRGVFGSLQLVHDHAEAILLHLHDLEGTLK